MRKFLIIGLILSFVLVGCTVPDSNEEMLTSSDFHQSAPSEDRLSQTDPNLQPEETLFTAEQLDPTEIAASVSEKTEENTEPTRPVSDTTPTEPEYTPGQASTAPSTPTVPTEETVPVDIPTPVDPQPETTVSMPTQPEETKPVETEPQIDKSSNAFKQEVAHYAALYINQYRAAVGSSPCEVLPGMTLVAEYRADQLVWNYAHDTADKREALAYYEYGRWVDATLAGLDASKSYYEADAAEAICAGFEGKTAEEMGKYIADLCRNSSSHWSYVGSSKFSYIGIGVEYRAGSAYGWYGCIMVGKTNYG